MSEDVRNEGNRVTEIFIESLGINVAETFARITNRDKENYLRGGIEMIAGIDLLGTNIASKDDSLVDYGPMQGAVEHEHMMLENLRRPGDDWRINSVKSLLELATATDRPKKELAGNACLTAVGSYTNVFGYIQGEFETRLKELPDKSQLADATSILKERHGAVGDMRAEYNKLQNITISLRDLT